MSTVNEALRYPMDRDDWLKIILIGGVLTLFGFLIIPLLAVAGYILRAIKTSMDGDHHPPAFGDWEELLIDGIKVAIIGIVYSIIPGIVLAVTVGGSIAAIATGTRGGAVAGFAGLTFGFFLGFILALIFGYIGVAALLNFAYTGRLRAAFDVGSLSSLVTNGDYAIAWLLSVVVFIGTAIVTGILNFIPLVGAIIGAFIFFYAEMVAANLWAAGFIKARGTE